MSHLLDTAEIRARYANLPEHMQSMAILDVLQLCDALDRLAAFPAPRDTRTADGQAMPEKVWVDREDMVARKEEPGFPVTAYVRADIHEAVLAENGIMAMALDKGEMETGLSTNGGFWRWWASKAREAAANAVAMMRERDAAMQKLQDLGQACEKAEQDKEN